MPRFHNINGNNVQFTAEEETARDNEETAFANARAGAAFATAVSSLSRAVSSAAVNCTIFPFIL